MRIICPPELDHARERTGRFATESGQLWGRFFVGHLCILSSGPCDGNPHAEGWEHVSVSTVDRTPTWEEMAMVKDLFWAEDECVVQFHPPRSVYVNKHPYCLHLWRNVNQEYALPPRGLLA